MTIEKKMLLFTGNRDGYSPEQCHHTMTIREMIEYLEDIADCHGDDIELFLSNDNGYTYGSISFDDINSGEVEEDDE